MVEWYNLLVLETKANIQEVGFEPILILLPKNSRSATLVQCLIESWWDTTHTFRIVEQGDDGDFHHMTGLSFERAIINLDSVLGIQLGLDMLGKEYPIETIRYFYLVLD